MIYEAMYRNQSIAGLLVWEFAALIFLGMLGWFIRLVYYVSGRKTRFGVSIAPFVIVPLLILFNVLSDGKIFNAIGNFLKTIMGLSSVNPNPYIGMVSMLLLAVILSGPIFLLLRRTQVRD